MPRVISLIVLLVIILMVGAVFFQVMAEFIVPLFLACVLLVVFQPLHAEILKYLPRWPRLGALVTTVLILLAVLLPLGWLGWHAYREGDHAVELIQSEKGHAFIDSAFEKFGEMYKRVTGNDFVRLRNEDLLKRVTEYVGPYVLAGVQTVLGMLIGLVIMIVALYFFLADGPKMINAIMQISPLEEEHELELLAKFGQISRSVVVATLASAIAQGIVAGIGYYFWLPSEAPIFLLTALTMVFAIVPFIGAAGVWVPVCLGLLLLGGGNDQPIGSNWLSVLSFAIYCTVVVSGLDNLIKPYVLHGQANLHPLLALLSILGGVKVLGPIGILIGPMLVSFLQALLSIFQREVENWENPQKRRSRKLSPAAEALAETIEAAMNTDDDKPSEKPRALPASAKASQAPRGGSAKARRRRR
ncbi:MAG: AI-2E family transporter [Planctomycetes bacterium]|nr:AI-2E family transporter [Planctomycetota bacterium]